MSDVATSNVYHINRRGTFTIEQAKQALSVVLRITQDYSRQVDQLKLRLQAPEAVLEEVREDVEFQIQELVELWQKKIQRLGGMPKGLWLVDFDSGDGYFCWKYPEPDLMYWHGYSEGYSSRKLISSKEPERSQNEDSPSPN